MINQVNLIGRLGNDAEVRTIESGIKFGRFSLATSESWKNASGEWQEQTEWHNITAWRELAGRLDGLKKGALVFVSGKITYRKYKDKDGIERTACDIVASVVRRLEKSDARAETGTQMKGNVEGMPWVAVPNAPEMKPVAAGAKPVDDDDPLPF